MIWQQIIREEADKPYFQQLSQFLLEDSIKHVIYPKHSEVFNAFKCCPLDQTKVVILGADPYINPNQAHGLAFSVKPNQIIPPSLNNIFKELKNDLGINPPLHGCLIDWAKQGVLLLNTVLTVRQGQSGSHQDRGWETFTDRIISVVNQIDRPVVFLLWGAMAKGKKKYLNNHKHLILEGSHPSPLSANRGGFFGGKYFSKCNEFLIENNQAPIDWSNSYSEILVLG